MSDEPLSFNMQFPNLLCPSCGSDEIDTRTYLYLSTKYPDVHSCNKCGWLWSPLRAYERAMLIEINSKYDAEWKAVERRYHQELAEIKKITEQRMKQEIAQRKEFDDERLSL